MTRTAAWLLAAGAALFIAVIASQGLPAVLSMLALAGWGLVLIAMFHLLPLVLDAVAMWVLFDARPSRHSLRDAVSARWVGESGNSLMPAGQIGGPMLMARHLEQRGMPLPKAAAAALVSMTIQAFAQIAFALMGLALLIAKASHASQRAQLTSSLIAVGALVLSMSSFYVVQRRGFFGKLMRVATRLTGKRDWSSLISRAEAIDEEVLLAYGRAGPVAVSFFLSLVGWVVGTVEVFLILQLLHSPASWSDSLLLESLGQAIRGAAFAIPGALGVQEGGYLLLAPLASLAPEVALALSMAKRAREVMLGLPGLLYWYFSERRRRVDATARA